MTRVVGQALDPETATPLARRAVYARLVPSTADLGAYEGPALRDTAITDSEGNWELVLRPSVGNVAHYTIRVWMHETYTVDVPDSAEPVNVNDIHTEPDPNLPDTPPSWQLPSYVKRSELGQPSGVATLGADGVLTESQRPPEGSVSGHIEDPSPHPVYDDLPSLALRFENALV